LGLDDPRQREQLSRRIVIIQSRLSSKVGRLRDRGQSMRLITDVLNGLDGGKAGGRRVSEINWDNLIFYLNNASWATYAKVLGHDELNATRFSTVLRHMIAKGWCTQKDFIAECPVSKSVVVSLLYWEGKKKNVPMKWTPDRLKLRDWLREQAMMRNQ